MSKVTVRTIEYPDHDHDEECDCEAEIAHSHKVDNLINNLESVPTFSMRDGMIMQDNWMDNDIKDFFLDHLNLDLDNANDSTHKIAHDCFEELMGENVGRVNAELMSAGIEWYLDKVVKKFV